MEEQITKQFNADSRAVLALKYLDYHKPAELRVQKQRVNQNESQFEQLKQRALLMNAHKVVSRPLGRGVLGLGLNPCDVATEFVIPSVSLNGKFFMNGSGGSANCVSVSLDMNLFPVEALHWPEFHNGVAETLSGMMWLHGSSSTSTTTAPPFVTREWIMGQKYKSDALMKSKRGVPELAVMVQYRHGGMLFGLGLLGPSLRVLRPDDIYRYLKEQNECVSVAVILGISLSYYGSQDLVAAKTCYLHVSAEPLLVGEDSADIPPLLTAASLAGLGFIFADSGNRKVAELLLAHIAGGTPVLDKPVMERECLSVSAAIGLGFVCLGKGNQLKLADKLVELIHSSERKPVNVPARGDTIVQDDPNSRSSVLFESCSRRKFNPTVTLPGACIALALVYIGTNDASVADRILVPKTSEQLELEPRVDALLFKFLARSLIMWDSICPSKDWVEQQLPKYLRDPSVLELKEQRLVGASEPSTVDWLQVLQSRLFAITGLALAVGLKYAGSGNVDAKDFLLREILHPMLVSVKWPESHCAGLSASRPSLHMAIDRSTVETCRCAVLLSVCVVMAGTGDLDVFRICRGMRLKLDENSDFGVSQAVHLAIGLLFLGGGKLTFKSVEDRKTKNFASTACILCTILPRYPNSVSDNRFSLQPLRHLFAKAVESRTIDLIDSYTGESTFAVPAKIYMRSVDMQSPPLCVNLPCVLPRKTDIDRIEIVSDRYLTKTLYGVPDLVGTNTVRVTLERVPGKFSHVEDPSGGRGQYQVDAGPVEGISLQVKKMIGIPIAGATSHFTEPGGVPLEWFTHGEIAAQAAITWERPELLQRMRLMERATIGYIGSVRNEREEVDKRYLTICEKYISELVALQESGKFAVPLAQCVDLMDNCVQMNQVQSYLENWGRLAASS